MRNFRTLATAAVASLVVAPLFIVAPAHATTIDVAGQRLNFGNAVDQEILENGEAGDFYLYENVVTVGGVVVDARVTIGAMSNTSLGHYDHEFISQSQIDELNLIDPNHVDVPGCYSNEDYVTAYEAGAAYDFLGFNAAGSLKGGDEVEYIDGYEDDEEWEYTISTSLSICDPGYTETADGYVDINVAFEVNGDPVTLENVAINATDIDNGQKVTFWDPAPSTFETSGDDSLVVIDDQADEDNYVTFTGPAEGDEEGFEDRYVGEVTYASVSEFNYTFEIVDGLGGSLQLAFDSYFHADDLASTGVDAAPAGIAGLAVLGLGSALVIARRVRRNRA